MGILSFQAHILKIRSSQEFQLALLRVSDINVEAPGAVIQVANELDGITTASLHLRLFRCELKAVVIADTLMACLGESSIGSPNPLCPHLWRP